MTLLGAAGIAMWWNVEAGHRAEFNDWHSSEHLPERLSIPGFLRGSRWHSTEIDGDYFVLYELDRHETLASPAYRARLDDPTPWSTRMMPLHRDMVRSQCRVECGFGAGLAGFMVTLRLSPLAGGDAALASHLRRTLAEAVTLPGVTAARFLRTDAPKAALTTEQRIRGGDAAADWIVLLSGYDLAALGGVCDGALSSGSLAANGADEVRTDPPYRLLHAMTPQDVAALNAAPR
jgi:hypothetical protein